MFRRRTDRSSESPSAYGRAQRAWHALPNAVLHPLESGLAKLLLALLLLVGLYALLGFVVAPRVLRAQLVELVHERYGRPLAVGEVRVHPFKLWVEVRDLALPDDDGKKLLRVGRFFVDFRGLASLWERAYVFEEIALEQPEIRLVVRPGGAINLADLAPANPQAKAAKPEPAKHEKDTLPRLWIQSLVVDGGMLRFVDRDRPKTYERTLGPVAFSVRDFRTTPAGGMFGLSASTGDGAQLDWKGKVALTPQLASSGSLTISRFPLASLAEYLADALPCELPSGMLDLAGSYALTTKSSLKLDLKLSRVAVRELTLRARDHSSSLARGAAPFEGASVGIARVELSDVRVALHRRQAEAARMVVHRLGTRAVLEPGGTLNLSSLLAPERKRDTTGAPEPSPWSAKLARFELTEATLEVVDKGPPGGAAVKLAPLGVSADNLSLDLAKPVAFEASVGVQPEGLVRVSGTVTPSPFAAQLKVHVEGIPLTLAQPYLKESTSLTIADGRLGLDGKVTLEPHGAAATKLALAVDLTVRDLRALDNAQHQDLLAFKQLALYDARYESAPASLRIDRVTLQKPYARLILSAQQELNVLTAFKPAASAKAGRVAMPPAMDAAELPREQKMAIEVKTVSVERMRVSFSDYFSQPHFAANMQNLSGTVRNLSSSPRSNAIVALRGTVEANSPMSIEGKLRPFAFDERSDVHLRVENIPLPIFNPYSGRFAGYEISRGELTTDITYKLRERRLVADHKIRIDQLTWGEATESKAKAPLPVKLATALLRDRHGVIELDLPIDGSLDDPEFRVWPLVWQVLKNIVVKAAMAPFDLLSSLFQGADKARFIDFEPGDAALSEEAKRALESLAKALTERPTLNVDVPLASLPQIDRAALVDREFRARVETILRSRAKGKGGSPPALDTLEAGDRIDVLAQLCQELTGKKPELPEAPEAPAGLSWREARAWRRERDADYLARTARGKVVITDDELAVLARRRGEAIEAMLVASGKLEATRVLLSTTGKVSVEKGKARFALELR